MAARIQGQTYNVPATGSTSIPCSATTFSLSHTGTYYSSNSDGYVVINAGSSKVLSITVSYWTEQNSDFITLYYGAGIGGGAIPGYSVSGTGTFTYVGLPGQTITFRFTSDSNIGGNFKGTVNSTGGCVAGDPCLNSTPLVCESANSFTLGGGAGAWNPQPGAEKVYSFTSAITGQYTLSVLNFFYNVTSYSSTVCSPAGWTPLSQSLPGNYLLNLTSGSTQYFLIDDNDLAATTGSCIIKCPSPDACTTGNYGASKAASSADEEIFNVSLGSLNNSSSCITLGPGTNSILKQYSNYAGFVNAPLLEPGDLYPLSVTIGECGSGSCSNGGISVYIDFDGNGSFNATTEKVWSKENCTSNSVAGTTYSTTILIPFSIPEGYKRMRVIYNCDGLTAPTATYNFGETEDYCLEVRSTVTSLLSQKPFGLHVNVFPNPTLGQLNVQLEKNNNYTLHILNTLGQVILSQAADMQTTIDLKDINSGIYFLKVMDKNHTLYTTRIIKE